MASPPKPKLQAAPKPPAPTQTAATVEKLLENVNQSLTPAPAPPKPATKPLRGVRKSTGEALESLFTFDCVRFERLIETAQFAVLYGLLSIFLGAGIDRLFQGLYAFHKSGEKEEPPRLTVAQFFRNLGVALLQVVTTAIVIFYIRKIADVVPFLFDFFCPGKYVSALGVAEVVTGETAIALVLVGIQSNFVFQMEQMRRFLVTRS